MNIDDLHPCQILPLKVGGHGSEVAIVHGEVKIGLGRHLSLANSVVPESSLYCIYRFIHSQERLDFLLYEPEYIYNDTMLCISSDKEKGFGRLGEAGRSNKMKLKGGAGVGKTIVDGNQAGSVFTIIPNMDVNLFFIYMMIYGKAIGGDRI